MVFTSHLPSVKSCHFAG